MQTLSSRWTHPLELMRGALMFIWRSSSTAAYSSVFFCLSSCLSLSMLCRRRGRRMANLAMPRHASSGVRVGGREVVERRRLRELKAPTWLWLHLPVIAGQPLTTSVETNQPWRIDNRMELDKRPICRQSLSQKAIPTTSRMLSTDKTWFAYLVSIATGGHIRNICSLALEVTIISLLIENTIIASKIAYTIISASNAVVFKLFWPHTLISF